MRVVDASTNVGRYIEDLQSAGVTAVGRYYSVARWKVLTKREAEELSAAGLSIFVVYEDKGSDKTTFTADSGTYQAQHALASAKDIGQPEGSAIYFGADFNATQADVEDRLLPFFRSVRDVFASSPDNKSYRIGIYSNGLACEKLLDSGLCELAWLSASSSYHGTQQFKQSGRWSLSQGLPIRIGQLEVDPNEYKGDFGAFQLPGPTHLSGALNLIRADQAGAREGLRTFSATSDAAYIPGVLSAARTPQGLAAARREAEQALREYPHNGCAAHLSALLRESGIAIPMTLGAGKLAHLLASRGWKDVRVGSQEAGDVGVCFDETAPAGADHIYFVVQRYDDDRMLIADNQRRKLHERYASGQGGKTPTEYFLRAV
jgi:Domain of unknown function (DUF1906)